MGGSKNDLFSRVMDPLKLFTDTKEDKDTSNTSTTDTQVTQTPTEADASVALAAAEERRRRVANSTILTSGLGASGVASTDKKKLLG